MNAVAGFFSRYPEISKQTFSHESDLIEIFVCKDENKYRYAFRFRLGTLFRSEYQTEGAAFATNRLALSVAREQILKICRGHKKTFARLQQTHFIEIDQLQLF